MQLGSLAWAVPGDGGARALSALKKLNFGSIRFRLQAVYHDMKHQSSARRTSTVLEPNEIGNNDSNEGQYGQESPADLGCVRASTRSQIQGAGVALGRRQSLEPRLC